MKKTTAVIFAAVILVACIFAGCNGAEGGKVTDNMQNLSEAMTGVQDMITDISEAFTNAPDTVTGIDNVTETVSESVTENTTVM